MTAMLASLATGSIGAVTVAFAHFMFNVFGVILVWPLKKIPITMATKLAELAIKNRLLPVAYILIVFFVLPFIFIYFAR